MVSVRDLAPKRDVQSGNSGCLLADGQLLRFTLLFLFLIALLLFLLVCGISAVSEKNTVLYCKYFRWLL